MANTNYAITAANGTGASDHRGVIINFNAAPTTSGFVLQTFHPASSVNTDDAYISAQVFGD